MTPKKKLLLALPLVAGVVLVLVYFQLFANPFVILVIFVLYLVVSFRNKRKFNRQKSQS